MPLVLIAAEHAPPEDAPWAISTRGMLQRNRQANDKFLTDCHAPFPGVGASMQTKAESGLDVLRHRPGV